MNAHVSQFTRAGILVSLAVTLTPLSAQTERRTLERPPEYDLPSLSSGTTRTPSSTVNSRSSSNSKIPDPSIFDGSKFPPEPRPERGLLANMERPGEEPPPVPGPGPEEGAGGQQQGGGEEDGSGGMQVAGIPGSGGAGGSGSIPGLPAIPTLGGGDVDGEGEGEGEPGEPGEPGGPGGPPPPANAKAGRTLDKPGEIPIGDPDATLAEAKTPDANSSAQLESAKGEDRMKIEAAQGSQPANTGRGTERGKDIPSNL